MMRRTNIFKLNGTAVWGRYTELLYNSEETDLGDDDAILPAPRSCSINIRGSVKPEIGDEIVDDQGLDWRITEVSYVGSDLLTPMYELDAVDALWLS